MSDHAPPDAVGQLRELVTTRTARYHVLGAEPATARRIWFVLHGYGMLAARFVRPFMSVIPADTCIVAPEALSRFYIEMPRADGGHLQRVGATWLTRESRDTEIADANRWLSLVHDDVMAERARVGSPMPTIAVLGFSQGVATATRWIASGGVAPAQFVAWAGNVATDVDRTAFAAAMRERELLFVSGVNDPFATAAVQAAVEQAIAALNVRSRRLTFDGAHHLDVSLLGTLLAELGDGPAVAL